MVLKPRRPTWGTYINIVLIIMALLCGTADAGRFKGTARSIDPDFEIASPLSSAARVHNQRTRCVKAQCDLENHHVKLAWRSVNTRVA